MKTQSNPLNLLLLTLLIIVSFLGFYWKLSKNQGALSLTSQAQSAWVSAALKPAKLNVEVGQEFDLSLFINSSSVAANVFSLEITFPRQNLELMALNKADSFALIWFEEEIDAQGVLRLTAGLPHPGFQNDGNLVTLRFKALASGQAEVGFSPKSAVFRNQDNKNILGLTKNAMVMID